MRGARTLVSWASGAIPRQITCTQSSGDILVHLCRQPYAPALRSGSNGSVRTFSVVSGLNRNSNCLRPHAGLLCSPSLCINDLGATLNQPRIIDHVRFLSSTRCLLEAKPPATRPKQVAESGSNGRAEEEEPEKGFELSEKGVQAAQINLSAKLSKDSTGGKKANFKEITRLLKIARPEAKSLTFAIICLFISSSISMSLPFAIGKVIDTATQSTGELGGELFGLSLPVFYSALAGILVVGSAANFGRVITLRIVGERIISRLRSKLYRQTFLQDAEFFDANRVGDLISRLSTDTLIVVKSVTQNLSDGLRALVSGIAGFSLMAYVSIKLSSILALLLPPIGLAAFFYGRAMRHLSRKIQKNLGTLTKISEERLGNVKTSQSFAGEIIEVHRYNTQIRNIFQLGKKEALISASFFSSTSLMGNLTILALLYFGGGMVQSGGISIGELSSFLMYTAYAGSSMFGLSSFYSELMKGAGASSRLFELQDRQPTIHPTKGTKVVSARGPIRFENVSFSYPTRPAVTIFRDLDFEIPQGRNVAIVGPSGGGKSTIASLLLRFYNPTHGRVLIGGKDISEMNAKSLRRKIGVVAQEPVLFSGTIAENISYGRPDATRADIIAAARKANCQFISDFPDGLDTQVGPRGTQLSGGQKQRIAIARALVKDPDILILDEATSALDAESETLVNSALAALLHSKNTTISIAHRLSTIKRSDTIIVLGPDGKVAEQGSYEELSSRPDGAFTKLMEWQMNGSDATLSPTSAYAPSVPEEEMWELQKEQEEQEKAAEEGYEDEDGKDNGTAKKRSTSEQKAS
ncbi:ATP-binding cassette permease mdl1 [Monascus purpureus]|uniref:ABC multidrug transporter MDR2 n=1 Tax=Monascus purpureus TaxID=5098 RepID=A0A507QUK6_MONPU|nr:ATP-binding cassette permease mdl1 [Monascus purpureus]